MFPEGLCQAKTHRGTRCGCKKVYLKKNGRWICKYHGGLSTGPKTQEGRLRISQGLYRYWADVKAGKRLPPPQNMKAKDRIRQRIRLLEQVLGK
jgi:hypothetical protein